MKGLIGQRQKDITLKLCDKKGKELVYADMKTLCERYANRNNMHLFVLPDGRVLDVMGDYGVGHYEFADTLFRNIHNKAQFRKISNVCKYAKKLVQDMGKNTDDYPYINYTEGMDMLIHYFGWVRVYQYPNVYGTKPATCTIDFPNPVLFGVDYTPEQEQTLRELYLIRNLIKDDEWQENSAERLKITKDCFVALFSNTNVR